MMNPEDWCADGGLGSFTRLAFTLMELVLCILYFNLLSLMVSSILIFICEACSCQSTVIVLFLSSLSLFDR
jgi:hypothetical protein